ncbi:MULTISPECIES: YbaN family protein [Ramlibacter]|uniref:DUF454 family protein n=1 Tax=Ramlibacter pinisoli TaxID=2682844 RepID=A0A6N8J0G1_9BURK|nr:MULTISPECIES: YbaN family protein [Ramlibacter]MBA2961809.1 YbaN family protein [Ramlibacter sp. CGMCC 1.13660]MVQ31750.1 DUF454 family protein [Ramlibacter pinisoli]
MRQGKQLLLKVVAVTCLVLGVIGVFVPVMPTVPFILAAAWAASRSSPRLNAWLEGHQRYGPMIRNWREGGIVGRSAKWAATTTMLVSVLFILIAVPNRWIAGLSGACMGCVLLWLWRRPER